jgi:enhancing lycopene biosynthesis protein 2
MDHSSINQHVAIDRALLAEAARIASGCIEPLKNDV